MLIESFAIHLWEHSDDLMFSSEDIISYVIYGLDFFFYQFF